MIIKKILMVAIIIISISQFVYATQKSIDSNTLINNAKYYDGKTVTFIGEAIGEIMKRGKYAWVNINDGYNAIGIYLPASEVEKIRLLGKHNQIGDIVMVKGVFHRACKEHGADLDIHANKIEIIKRGYIKKEVITPIKAIFATIFFISGVTLIGYAIKKNW